MIKLSILIDLKNEIYNFGLFITYYVIKLISYILVKIIIKISGFIKIIMNYWYLLFILIF